jgi:glycerol-3-phosphate dehydrogenase (NAD(P)+)
VGETIMAVITVLGAGMMGSALCVPLADRGHDVRLVGTHLDRDIVHSLRATRLHPKLELELPAAIRPMFLEELEAAADGAELLALGVSSAGVRWAAERIAPFCRAERPLFMISKGLSWDGTRLGVLPDVVRDALPEPLRSQLEPAAVAGPCIAGELARRVETCVVLAGRDAAVLGRITAALATDYYHLWPSTDLCGAEICAALKNAYAMGVAFGTGQHLARGGQPGSVARHNVESAVFAQAIREMRRIVSLCGGDSESVIGLPGVGDLDVTTNGGRTGRFGALLGQGLSVSEAVARMAGATLECIEIIAVLRQAMQRWQEQGALRPGQLPLLEHMAAVVLDGARVSLPLARFFGE